jgi:hypothetical protein
MKAMPPVSTSRQTLHHLTHLGVVALARDAFIQGQEYLAARR